MSYQITTSYQNKDSFRSPGQNKIFIMSNDDLVCITILQTTSYTVSRYSVRYSVSTNSGANWSSAVALFTNTSFCDVYQSGNTIYVGRIPSSSGNPSIQWFSYSTVTHTFTFTATATVSLSSTYDRPNKLIIFDNKYWFLNIRNGYSLCYASYIDTPLSGTLWTTKTSGTIGGQPLAMDAVSLSDKLLFFAVYNSKFYVSSITKSGGVYSFSAWTELGNAYNSESSITAYNVSDTEIYIAVRTSTGYKIYPYDGSTLGTAFDASTQQNDNYGQFLNINDKLVFTYLRENSGGTNWGLFYRYKKPSGWSTEGEIIAYSATQIYEYSSMKNASDDFIRYAFTTGAGAPFTINYDTFEVVASGSSFISSDDAVISDEAIFKPSLIKQSFSENIVLSDISLFQPSGIKFTDGFIITDDLTLLATPTGSIDADENIILSDELSLLLHKKLNLFDNFNTSDDVSLIPRVKINNPYKIISYNPLIVITDTSPTQIVKFDTSNLSKITWEVLNSDFYDIKDLKYNSINNYFYFLSENQDVIKIDEADFNNQITIDTTDLDNLKSIDINENVFKSYINTNNNTGELILIDEADFTNIELDIRILAEKAETIDCIVSTLNGQIINTDIRILQENINSISLDVRVLKYDYSKISQYPIDYTKLIVTLNNVDLVPINDIDLSSIKITHSIDSKKSVASFVLQRNFDNLDKTLNGVSSIITANNNVEIYINNVKEFTGKVSNINTGSETETVAVTCVGERPSDNRSRINIPFSTLNDSMHLYDCLLSNITIDNPYIDPLDENPDYYKGIKIDKGESRNQNVSRWTAFFNVVDKINDGTFQPKSNWSYFWFVSLKKLYKSTFGPFTLITNDIYIGPSLSPISTDVIELVSARHKYQRVYEDDVYQMGYYYIGEAPYLEVSGRNGKLDTVTKWEDRSDGLYSVKEQSYNYVPYVSKIANLEYSKLKNINGDILPITSCDIEISLDAYYFYKISLLKRVGFSNTISTNIYKDLNGFPVSIKQIEINIGTMRVSLQATNQLSNVEVDEINALYPNEDNYIRDEDSSLQYSKYDVTTGQRIF